MDAARLDEAVQFAVANENPATKDLAIDLATTFGAREPFDTPIGPMKTRGAANGLMATVLEGHVREHMGVRRNRDTDAFLDVVRRYVETLQGVFVLADQRARRLAIEEQIAAVAAKLGVPNDWITPISDSEASPLRTRAETRSSALRRSSRLFTRMRRSSCAARSAK